MNLGLSLSLCATKSSGGSTPSTLDQLNALLAGNSSIVDFTQATTSPLDAQDLSDLNNDWGSGNLGTDPTISGTLGIVCTGGNENIAFPVSGGTYTLVFRVDFDATDTSQIVISDNASGQILRLISGSLATLPFTTLVDGVAMATRDDAFTALAVSGEHTVQIQGIDLTGLTLLTIGRGGGAGFAGSSRRAVTVDEGSVTGSNLTDARALAETWVSET